LSHFSENLLSSAKVLKKSVTQPSSTEAESLTDTPKANRWGMPNRLRLFLLILFVSAPAIFTGIGIAKNGVDVPVWDDWERGVMIEKLHEGMLDFHYLNGAHIDHRMLFPRLIQLAVNGLTDGNLKAELYVSYGIFVLGGVAMFFLVRRTFGKDSAWVWPVAFAINTILFAPIQYQNFLWAVQIAILIPIACLPVCVLVMVSNLAWWKKLLLAVPVAVIGTHSFAHGILLWPICFCLALLLREFGTWKQRTAFLVIFGACAATVISAYFLWDFETVTYHSYGKELGETPPSGSAIERIGENSVRFCRYFFYVLGSPLARMFHMDPYQSAKNVARGCLFLFVLGAGFMFWRRKDSQNWDKMLPWIAIGMFSICAAVLMASGRCHLNVYRAMLPRYISLTMFLAIAIVALGAYLLQRWQARAGDPLTAAKRVQVASMLCVGVVMLQFPQWIYGFHKMTAWRLARLEARACLLYINHKTPGKYGLLDNTVEFVQKYANVLNDHGLLSPPLFGKPDFGSFTFRKESLNTGRAKIGRTDIGDGTSLYVDGYATLPDDERLADGILWTWRPKGTPQGGWKVLSFGEMNGVHVPRAPFIDSQFGNNSNYANIVKYAGWKNTINLAQPMGGPIDAEKIQILPFAMDVDRMELHPFTGGLEVDFSKADGVPRVKIVESIPHK
jgi:hypothetical protein